MEPVITRKPESAFESWFGKPREANDVNWEEQWSVWWNANKDKLIAAEATGDFWIDIPGTLLDA
ncbi:MAG: hypothetical protein ACI8TQ_004044 [Planctomycetota bacterium]